VQCADELALRVGKDGKVDRARKVVDGELGGAAHVDALRVIG